MAPYNDVLGHLSFALTALSFFMRDILLLRLIAVGSILIGIFYNLRLAGGPLWLVIFWLLVMLAINTHRIITHILERRGIAFSEEERDLYQTIFHNFAPFEFLKLLRLGRWETAAEGTVLAAQGETLSDLKFIYYGEVAVEKEGREIARTRDGTLIGEVSYLDGGRAAATVRTTRRTRYIAWPQNELRRLLTRNPTMDLAMKSVLSEDLIRKLMDQTGPLGGEAG